MGLAIDLSGEESKVYYPPKGSSRDPRVLAMRVDLRNRVDELAEKSARKRTADYYTVMVLRQK